MPFWKNLKKGDLYIYSVSGIFIIAGLLFRFYDLDIDPPLFFSDTSQDLLTDPYNVVWFARNAVLFGDWDIFDYPRWIIFKYSITSFTGYLAFLALGVSRLAVNFSAVILSTGGLILAALAAGRISRRGGFITAALLLCHMPLMVYGRYPFLENGLIFISGLLFFITIWNRSLSTTILLSGPLLALAILSGKLFGLILIVPSAIAIYGESSRARFRNLILFALTALVSIAALLWIFHGGHLEKIMAYFSEQTTGMYGFPEALTSPQRFFEQMISFGAEARLFYYTPFFLALLFICGLGAILNRSQTTPSPLRRRMHLFCLGWFFTGMALLMIMNYRPLRYELFLIMPLAVLAGTYMAESKPSLSTPPRWITVLLLILACWYFLTQNAVSILGLTNKETEIARTVWYVLPAGLIMAGIIYFYRRRISALAGAVHVVLWVLALIFVLNQTQWTYDWLSQTPHALKEANEDLAQILAPEAVVIGPYAQSLTIDNNLKSFIYMFGLAQTEPDLFEKQPLTHLAVDISNWESAAAKYPLLSRVNWITSYWIREIQIRIVRLDDSILAEWGRTYNPTDFEKAIWFYHHAQADSCLKYLQSFMDKYPKNKSGLVLLSNLLYTKGAYRQAFETYDRLISYYPDDFSLYLTAGIQRYEAYLLTNNQRFLQEAENLFDKSLVINRYAATSINEIKQLAEDYRNRP